MKTEVALPANKYPSFIFGKDKLIVAQVGHPALKMMVPPMDMAAGRAVLDVVQVVELKDVQVRGIETTCDCRSQQLYQLLPGQAAALLLLSSLPVMVENMDGQLFNKPKRPAACWEKNFCKRLSLLCGPLQEKEAHPEDLIPKNPKLDRILHCFLALADAGAKKLPPSFTSHSNREQQVWSKRPGNAAANAAVPAELRASLFSCVSREFCCCQQHAHLSPVSWV